MRCPRDDNWVGMDTDLLSDAIEIDGLAPLFEDEEAPLYLDLRLRSGARRFQAAILRSGEEWTLNVRDERGRIIPGSGELYDTISDAVLAALGLSLEIGRRRALRAFEVE